MSIETLYIEEKKTLMPQLRFHEFVGEWTVEELGNISRITSGGTPSRNNKFFWNGDVPWITTSLINFNVIKTSEEFITQEAVLKSSAKLFPKGTILMAMYGQGKTRGKVALLGIDATTNQACGAILPNVNLDKNYLYQNLAGRYDEIRDLSNEGGQQNLSGNIIKGIKISFPTLPEQQKIASFLSAVDEKIQQLSRKKELLEQYKKGVMQQLFSGKLRFKDENGEDYSDWEEKILGDVVKNVGGTALEKHVNSESKYKFISIGNYSVNGVYIDNNQRINLNDKTKEKLLNKNDLVMVLNDKTKSGDLIGSSILIDADDTYIYNQRSERLICKQNAFPLFMWFLLNSSLFRKDLFSVSQGGTQIYVNFPNVKKLQILVPSLIEQQKIAIFLSSIDDKIESTNKQIIQTQTFKKGLLQQMFV